MVSPQTRGQLRGLGIAVVVFLVFTLGAATVAGVFFDEVGPWLADHPDRQRPLGVATGAVFALPLLALLVLRPRWVRGWVVFGVTVFLGLQAAVLGIADAREGANATAVENTTTWRAQAGAYPRALLLTYLLLGVPLLVLALRRVFRHRDDALGLTAP